MSPRVEGIFSPQGLARGIFLFVLQLSLETVMRLCLLSLIFTSQRILKRERRADTALN